MKQLYKINLAALILLHSHFAIAWSGDVLVHSDQPIASHSMAAKSNGVLFIAIPQFNNGVYSIIYKTSSNGGNTWQNSTTSINTFIDPIIKTKMVHTGSDSIYCLFSSGTVIYIQNVESGISGTFNQTLIDDFDAAASSISNAIYLFVDEPGNNNIKRYGTLDGGISWTGNTATVTTQGASPRVYMSDSRLILNYYGPVLSNVAKSVIRAAFYDESTPGNITPGTFLDIQTDTTIFKKQFKSVITSNTVWFFYTEGDTQQIIKYKYSTNNGSSYSQELPIAITPPSSAYLFDAHHYTLSGTTGCYLTYYNPSITVPPTPFPMMFTSANIASPSVFSTATAYSDFNVTDTPSYHLPVIIPFNNSGVFDVGVAWVENDGQGNWVYFDRFSATTSLNPYTSNEWLLNAYFKADQLIMIPNKPINEPVTVGVYNLSGQLVYNTSLMAINGSVSLKMPLLSSGIYVCSLQGSNWTQKVKVLKNH
jgi:hypothetical protein